jgi:hypothetical protein
MHGTIERHRVHGRKPEPLPPEPKPPSAAPSTLISASARETDPNYIGVVAVLNDKLRVIHLLKRGRK